MGSSAKTGKKNFRGSPEHFLDKNDIWDRTPPHLHINCSIHVWGRVQGSQIFKQNSIISIHSKVMAFLVISLSPWSPRCPHIIPTSSPCCPHYPHIVPRAPRRSPCGLHGCCLRGLRCLHPMLSLWSPCCSRCPHVIPVIPMSSPCHPRCPHIVPIAPRRSPCGLHGCGLRCLRCLHPMLSPWSPCCPRCPRVVPVVPMSSPCHPHHPHVIPIAPRRSPCGLHGCGLRGLRCLRGLHSMLSPWSLHHPRCPHIVPVSSLSFPHCLEGPHIIPNPPDTHSTHPLPPGVVGGPESVKMQ